MLTETVSVPVKSGGFNSHYARPDGSGPFPGVVVIHEIYGLNDNIREVAERFAGEGYAALAVDMYSGRNRVICMARFMGGMALRPLSHAGLTDLASALTWLGARPEVDAERLGAIGFCLGGGFAIAWACNDDRLKVIAPFYSMNPRPLEAVARSCPVVGSFPEKDFTTGGGRKLAAVLERLDVPNDIVIYPDAKHSFFNDHGDNYDEQAAGDAWQRTLAYFETYLGSSG